MQINVAEIFCHWLSDLYGFSNRPLKSINLMLTWLVIWNLIWIHIQFEIWPKIQFETRPLKARSFTVVKVFPNTSTSWFPGLMIKKSAVWMHFKGDMTGCALHLVWEWLITRELPMSSLHFNLTWDSTQDQIWDPRSKIRDPNAFQGWYDRLCIAPGVRKTNNQRIAD